MEDKYDLVFPQHLISSLMEQRGETWRGIVKKIQASDSMDAQKIAFVLMIARLSGCATCNADSLRALRGCAVCARQSVTRYKGSDQSLIAAYNLAYQEVEGFLSSHS